MLWLTNDVRKIAEKFDGFWSVDFCLSKDNSWIGKNWLNRKKELESGKGNFIDSLAKYNPSNRISQQLGMPIQKTTSTKNVQDFMLTGLEGVGSTLGSFNRFSKTADVGKSFEELRGKDLTKLSKEELANLGKGKQVPQVEESIPLNQEKVQPSLNELPGEKKPVKAIYGPGNELVNKKEVIDELHLATTPEEFYIKADEVGLSNFHKKNLVDRYGDNPEHWNLALMYNDYRLKQATRLMEQEAELNMYRQKFREYIETGKIKLDEEAYKEINKPGRIFKRGEKNVLNTKQKRLISSVLTTTIGAGIIIKLIEGIGVGKQQSGELLEPTLIFLKDLQDTQKFHPEVDLSDLINETMALGDDLNRAQQSNWLYVPLISGMYAGNQKSKANGKILELRKRYDEILDTIDEIKKEEENKIKNYDYQQPRTNETNYSGYKGRSETKSNKVYGELKAGIDPTIRRKNGRSLNFGLFR